jgi:ubiquinone/menaquinone biosynthesis C-methylase UbiE
MLLEQIREAYDACARTYAEKLFHELSYKPLDRQLLDRFVEMTSQAGPIMDVGCGPGQTTRYLHSQGAKVTGIDISERMIDEAKRRNPEISFHVDNMLHLKAENGSLAGVCAFYAIVNFQYPDIKKIFLEFHRVLKNGGVLLLAFHVEEKEVHVADVFESGKPLDFFFFDENKIIDLLKKSEFEIVEALVRFPYQEEHSSKRAYLFARKKQGEKI